MRNIIISIIIITFSIFFDNYAQGPYTYGPVKENNFDSWIGREGITPHPWAADHQIGVLSDQGYIWEARTITYWEWTTDQIPLEAEVISVRLKFKAVKYEQEDLHLSFHNIQHPFNEPNINFYDECNNSNEIYENTFQQTNGTTVYFDEVFDQQSVNGWEIWDAIQNAVSSGSLYFTLGIKALPNMTTPPWLISDYNGATSSLSPAIDLIIVWDLPHKNVTVDQKLLDGSSAGNVDLYVPDPYSQSGNWNSYQVPHTFDWEMYRSKVLRASWDIFSNEKYNNWNGNDDVKNHYSFYIDPNTSDLTAHLKSSKSSIQMHNNLPELNIIDAGKLKFKDPWFINYSDPDYYDSPYGYRNLGTNAKYEWVNSPFTPNTGSGDGSEYKGVFLGQPIVSGKPYYSIYSAQQDITLTQTGRTHRF